MGSRQGKLNLSIRVHGAPNSQWLYRCNRHHVEAAGLHKRHRRGPLLQLHLLPPLRLRTLRVLPGNAAELHPVTISTTALLPRAVVERSPACVVLHQPMEAVVARATVRAGTAVVLAAVAERRFCPQTCELLVLQPTAAAGAATGLGPACPAIVVLRALSILQHHQPV